jgi:parvulin-like peptidyl-prolyl isomerase
MSPRTQILKEPLLHFLVIGAVLFGAYAWLNRDGGDSPARQVRLGESDVRWLKETFVLEQQREPTQEELRGLVRGLVKEELLAREAQEQGLDKDDIVVRRRLAQKMTFLLQDNSLRTEPAEDELRRFYATQQDKFQAGPRTLFTRPRITFTQVFFSRDKRTDAAADARQALQELSQTSGTARPAEMGDRTQAASEIRNADERAVANQFGTRFAAEIFSLEPGLWHGPIESREGFHLVRVTELVPARLRPFEEIREQVLEQWREQRQRENEERYFAELLKKYRVVPDESVRALVDPLLDRHGAPP